MLNRIPSLATTKMIKCVHLAQEKVYHSLAVNFLTSDSFASCTEMYIFGNSILCLLILSSKTVKTVKTKTTHIAASIVYCSRSSCSDDLVKISFA